jgi:hypothetical protein
MKHKQTTLFALNLMAACWMTVGSVANAAAATVAQYKFTGSKACADGRFGTNNAGFFTLCIHSGTINNDNPETSGNFTYLNYSAIDNNIWSSGYGDIPPSAVQFTPNQVILSVNPASVPGFSQEGLTGNISLTWDKTPLWSSQSAGRTQSTLGTMRTNNSGTSQEDSASSKGIVFGYPFQNSNSSIGKTKDLGVTIER